jgi:hypothetical protein
MENQNSWSPAVNRPVELFGRTETEKGEEGEGDGGLAVGRCVRASAGAATPAGRVPRGPLSLCERACVRGKDRVLLERGRDHELMPVYQAKVTRTPSRLHPEGVPMFGLQRVEEIP